MSSIEWTGPAVADLKAIWDFTAQDDASAAKAVTGRIVSAVERLERFPGSGRPGRVSGTRELIPAQLPYVIVYETTDRTVRVLRVLHAARSWPPLQ